MTRSNVSAPPDRTDPLFLRPPGSLGTREHHGIVFDVAQHQSKSSHTSPTKTWSRASSKKSNQSQRVTNGKLDGNRGTGALDAE